MNPKQEQEQTPNSTTRRQFIRNAGVAAAAATVASAGPTGVAKAPAKALGPNERIGIGVIGCGGRGRHHLRTLRKLKEQGLNIQIAALCDVYRPRLNKSANEHGGKTYMDHRELLGDPNVHVVCIASPDHHHCPQAIDAIHAGKDVYVEKPLSHWDQHDVAKQLFDEVRQSDRIVQVGTQGMSDAAWIQMGQLVKQGVIGRPIHAESGFFRLGDFGERGMPIDDPKAKPGKDLNWEAFLGDRPKRQFTTDRFFCWRMFEDYAGGPATDLFPHTLTPIISILGVKEPDKAVALGGKYRYQEREVPDTFNTLIEYPEKITVAILGTQGNDFCNIGNIKRGAGQRIPVIRGWEGALTVEGNEIVHTPVGSGSKDNQPSVRRIPIEHGEDFPLFWKEFLSCCRTRQKPISGIELAYNVNTALQMAYLSLREGRTARFDAVSKKIVV